MMAVVWLAACSAERASVTPSLRQSVECGDGVQVEASLDETRAAARAVLLDEAFRVAALGDQLKANRRFGNIATGTLVLLGRGLDVVADSDVGSGAVLRLNVALTDLGGHVCLNATAAPVGFAFAPGAFEHFLSAFGDAVRHRIERTRKPPPVGGVGAE